MPPAITSKGQDVALIKSNDRVSGQVNIAALTLKTLVVMSLSP